MQTSQTTMAFRAPWKRDSVHFFFQIPPHLSSPSTAYTQNLSAILPYITYPALVRPLSRSRAFGGIALAKRWQRIEINDIASNTSDLPNKIYVKHIVFVTGDQTWTQIVR